MRRIVVTGLGVICALGRNGDETWANLAAGQCGVGPITVVDPRDLKIAIAAEVKGYRAEDHFDDRAIAQIDRFGQFAVVAAREAIAAARLAVDPLRSDRIAPRSTKTSKDSTNRRCVCTRCAFRVTCRAPASAM
jgi:3-oxoacyl-(acyl-carrier-protein) synthase